MKYYIIHNKKYPLRRVFLIAQFKRYNITNYEFFELHDSNNILFTYIELIYTISLILNDSLFCIMIDTILITQNFLDRVNHCKSINTMADIVFIHTSSNDSMKMKINTHSKLVHKDCWEWKDQLNYSTCFIITHTHAKLLYKYHLYCEKINDYETFYNKRNTLKCVDSWLFNSTLMYSNNSLKILWIP